MCMDFFEAKLKCVYEHNETTLDYCRERKKEKYVLNFDKKRSREDNIPTYIKKYIFAL